LFVSLLLAIAESLLISIRMPRRRLRLRNADKRRLRHRGVVVDSITMLTGDGYGMLTDGYAIA